MGKKGRSCRVVAHELALRLLKEIHVGLVGQEPRMKLKFPKTDEQSVRNQNPPELSVDHVDSTISTVALGRFQPR